MKTFLLRRDIPGKILTEIELWSLDCLVSDVISVPSTGVNSVGLVKEVEETASDLKE